MPAAGRSRPTDLLPGRAAAVRSSLRDHHGVKIARGCSPGRPRRPGRAGTDLGPRDPCTEQYNDLVYEPSFRQGASVQGRAEAVTSVVSVLRCTYRHTSSLYTLSDVLPVITSTVTSAMTSRDRDGVSWQASRSVTHVQYSLRRASPFGLTKQLCQRHEGAYSVPTRALRDTPVPAALLPPPCRPGHTTLLPATL